MYDKLTSDVVTTIVGMAKGERPTMKLRVIIQK